MAKPTAVWGLDMGQCALKALKLELVDGKPTATAFDYIEHPKIMSQPDADPEALAREALDKFLSRNPLNNDIVSVGVAGQSGGLARFVKLPPVEESRIADIVRFEAKQQIPFPLEEVVWDFQKIAGGEVINNFAMETEIGLFAMKRDMITRHLAQYGGSGIECNVVQMAPLALTNFATYELLKKGGVDAPMTEEVDDDTPRGKKRCIVVLDVGTDTSNLIITDAGKIIWQRPMSLGGSHFTRALSKEMKLTFAKAEHLKRNAAKSPDLAQILKSLRPVLTDFVSEVQRSLGYFTNTHRDAHIASMVGLGSAFKLPGLQKYMAEKLSLQVTRPSKFHRLAGEQVLADPVFSENILTFPIAYGLALQGLNGLGERTDYGRINTNLLPQEVQTERVIRAKKPFAAAAAASLLLGSGLAALGFGAKYSAANDPAITKAAESAKSVKSSADSQEQQKTAGFGDLDKNQAEVKAIVAGSERRLDWVRLHQLLTAALPRVGEQGNLMAQNKLGYWNDTKYLPAMKAYNERVKSGLSIDRVNDDDLTKYLAQVNVQETRTRYTDNLKTFLETADQQVWAVEGKAIAGLMLPSEREEDENKNKQFKPKIAEGGGWVVELRGWTFHERGTQFLVDGLVRNFQEYGTNSERVSNRKVSDFVPGATDPLKDRVSHVCLLLSRQEDDNSQRKMLELISPGRLYVEKYLNAGAAGLGGFGPGAGPGEGGPMPPGGSPGAGPEAGFGAAAKPAWSPLDSGAAAGGPGEGAMAGPGGGRGAGGSIGPGGPGGFGGFGGGGGESDFGYEDEGPSGGPGMPGGDGPRGAAGIPGGVPGGTPGVPGGNPGTATTTKESAKKKRTVFVLMFVWRDPAGSTPAGAGAPAEPAK